MKTIDTTPPDEFFNVLQILVKSVEFNGMPSIRVFLNDELLIDTMLEDTNTAIKVYLKKTDNLIKIERYGKTYIHTEVVDSKIVNDQTIEIEKLLIDDVPIPTWLLHQNSFIEFDATRIDHALILGPNGFWTFTFEMPIITYVLDEIIKHEAKYNDTYKYPWGAQLGPSSVEVLSKAYEEAKQIIRDKL